MAGYFDNTYYEYHGDSQGYPQSYYNDEDYPVYDSAPTSYTNGAYDESPSPSSGMGSSSTAMSPSASQSSHGSNGQYYCQSSPQWIYIDSYGDASTEVDQLSRVDAKYYTPEATRQASDIYDFEQTSASSSPLKLKVSKHRNLSFRGSGSPKDYAEPFTLQELSPVSPSFPSQSRKSSSARKSDVSYPCLAHGCTSTARFKRVADLQRHWQSVHSGEHYDCPIVKCHRKGKNGLGRKDHLRDHLKDVHMQSPEQVKLWMDEVQTITNLRNIKKNLTPEQVAEAQEMERKMPSAKLVLEYE